MRDTCDQDADEPSESSKPVMQNLPYRCKSSIRQQCIQSLKSLQDELYIITDKNVLSKTLTMLNEIISYTRKNHPVENGISLEDKTLSPKKKQKKATIDHSSTTKQKKLVKLSERKRKNPLTNRVGAAADTRRKVITVEDEDS